jgi:hypothetical protein
LFDLKQLPRMSQRRNVRLALTKGNANRH